LVAAVTLFVIGWTLKELYFAIVSENWPSTKGKITYSQVEVMSRKHAPKVIYEYTVNGQNCSNSKISFSQLRVFPKTAQIIVSQYQIGEEVDVYYSPQHPKYSVLERGNVKRALLNALVFGAGFSGLTYMITHN